MLQVDIAYLRVFAVAKLVSSTWFATRLWTWGPQLQSERGLQHALAHIAFDTVCQLVASLSATVSPVTRMPFQNRPLTLSLAYSKDWPVLVVHLMAGTSAAPGHRVPQLLPILWAATTRMFKAFDLSGVLQAYLSPPHSFPLYIGLAALQAELIRSEMAASPMQSRDSYCCAVGDIMHGRLMWEQVASSACGTELISCTARKDATIAFTIALAVELMVTILVILVGTTVSAMQVAWKRRCRLALHP